MLLVRVDSSGAATRAGAHNVGTPLLSDPTHSGLIGVTLENGLILHLPPAYLPVLELCPLIGVKLLPSLKLHRRGNS